MRPAFKADKWFRSDNNFNALYPLSMQLLAQRHWTSTSVAKSAAGFLVTGDHTRVLDIGSGVGKFCLNAAHWYPNASFYGIEQRNNLVAHAESARQTLGLPNVTFLHGNFTQLSFKEFDHFYFYNAFFENLVDTDKIDDNIDYSDELYFYYCRYLHKQLTLCPKGTRLATFHSLEDEIPADFYQMGGAFRDLLKFWIKS